MGFNIDKLKEIAVPRSEAAKESARTRRENREYLRKSTQKEPVDKLN
jgi:hypothetical protein